MKTIVSLNWSLKLYPPRYRKLVLIRGCKVYAIIIRLKKKKTFMYSMQGI